MTEKATFALQSNIDICGGKGEGLYFSILGCNQMSPGREQFYFSLEHSTLRAAGQSSFSHVPGLFVQKAPVVQKHENIHGELFPHKSRGNKNSFLLSMV